MLTLKHTAERIMDGVEPVIAFKEHIDAWNRSFNAALYEHEPPITGKGVYIDAWLAGAAEYEAFMIDAPIPAWSVSSARFLAEPLYLGGKNSQIIALVETPFAFRRRLLFTGKTFIRMPARSRH